MSERELMRKEMRRRREQSSAMRLLEWSARIGERLIVLPEYLRARRIFCYCSTAMEVQTGGMIREFLRTGREVYLPVTDPREHRMTATRLRDPDAVHRGAFDIMEPDGNETIEPEKLDLILTPGLAFDREGGRLGQGAGCFDRFLPHCRGLIVALAFEWQLVDKVPMEPHDCRVDRIITERDVYHCARNHA